MAKGITFEDAGQANEYAALLREQGYDSHLSHDKQTGRYTVQITASTSRTKKKAGTVGTTTSTKTGGLFGGTAKVARMIGRGISDIGESMETPYSEKRPKISQLPRSRSEIPIAQQPNLENLKMPGLRGKTVSGIPRRE